MKTGSLAGLRINFNQRAPLAGFITPCVAVWDRSGSIQKITFACFLLFWQVQTSKTLPNWQASCQKSVVRNDRKLRSIATVWFTLFRSLSPQNLQHLVDEKSARTDFVGYKGRFNAKTTNTEMFLGKK